MSLIDSLIGNLRSNALLYIVCVLGLIAVVKYMGDSPKQKKFAILGVCLIGGGALAGLAQGVLWAVVVGQPGAIQNHQDHFERIKLYGTLSGVLSFLLGAVHAAGVGALLYALLADKMTISAARPKRRSRRDEDDEDDRPRRRSRRDEDDDEDDRPRPRRRRDEDD